MDGSGAPIQHAFAIARPNLATAAETGFGWVRLWSTLEREPSGRFIVEPRVTTDYPARQSCNP
jgi:hypothetical protein